MLSMQIEGTPSETLWQLTPNDQDALLAFGRPITFHIGTAEVLAEFNRDDGELIVNLAHIEGGGEVCLSPYGS